MGLRLVSVTPPLETVSFDGMPTVLGFRVVKGQVSTSALDLSTVPPCVLLKREC